MSRRFEPLLDVPGVFVFGSNDYFAPTLRNPLRYLLPDDGQRHVTRRSCPGGTCRAAFDGARLARPHQPSRPADRRRHALAFAGVDDPHLGYDQLDAVPARPTPTPTSGIGVAHAPYLRVLDQYAADGYDPVLAGHTHGGQVCLPGGRALTTNCDLEPARAKGLHRHPPTRGRAIRARRGCTSRPAGHLPYARSGSAAAPRPPC